MTNQETLITKIVDALMQHGDPADMPNVNSQARYIADSGAYGLAGGELVPVSPPAIRQLRSQGVPAAFIASIAKQAAAKIDHPGTRTHAQFRGMGFESMDEALGAEQLNASRPKL